MDEELNQIYQMNAIKWLFDNQLVDDPQFINHLNINILVQSRMIKHCEFLIVQEKEQILVYIELNWLGRTRFFKQSILDRVSRVVKQLMPNYANRIVDDKSILELSIKRLKEALGGPNANTDVNYYISNNSTSSSEEQSG